MTAHPSPDPRTSARHRIGRDADVLSTILRPDTSCVVWRRRLPGDVADMARFLAAHGVATREMAVTPALSDVDELLRDLPATPACDWIRSDVARLVLRLAMLAEVARVKACFGATTTNACRKFHADYVGLRILCTYAGPGTDGVDEAKALLTTAYGMIMRTKTWAMGDAFTMADCAAAPALFYANRVMPFVDTHKNAAAYYGRLRERPSYVRALEDARPYLALFPE